ncbi:hypothetical protein [Peptacetobacter sp.]|uniref:hypothetical protein n=1 Tax=Peptacetobacter sp. TaxID=2991975 RepID=UPI002632F8CC|nr:hypothetical protein [Peptacetobacter sp.]
MKIILKDINNPKSNIPDKRKGDVRISFLVSIILLFLFGKDFINILNSSNSNLSDSKIFANDIVLYLFMILLLISCILSIVRFIFMELGKDCIYINDLVFSILVAILLVINLIISIFSKSFNIILFLVTIVFVVTISINVIRENKK